VTIGKLVHLTNVSIDLLIARSDLTAAFAGIWAAATRESKR
jgi:hypothetical protein